MAESPKGIASLSGAAAGLLQSFITSFASSVSHKSLPQARYRLWPMFLIIDRFFLSRLESLSADAPSLPNPPRAVKGETVSVVSVFLRSNPLVPPAFHSVPFRSLSRERLP